MVYASPLTIYLIAIKTIKKIFESKITGQSTAEENYNLTNNINVKIESQHQIVANMINLSQKARHRDRHRSFISDIYRLMKELTQKSCIAQIMILCEFRTYRKTRQHNLDRLDKPTRHNTHLVEGTFSFQQR